MEAGRGTPIAAAMTPLVYPPAPRGDFRSSFHGIEVADPYRPLEDSRSRETEIWREAQDALARDFLSRLPDRDRITAALDSLPRAVPERLPVSRGGVQFRFGVSSNGGVSLLREVRGAPGKTEVVFDPAQTHELQSLRLNPQFAELSPSGRYLAAGLGVAGSDWMRLHLIDLDTGQARPGVWPETAHQVVAWLPDDSGFHYNVTRSHFGPAEVRDGVYFHRLGTDPRHDELIFDHEGGEGHAALPLLGRNGQLLLVKTMNFVTQQAALHVQTSEPRGFRCLLPAEAAFNVIGEHDGELFIETQWQASRGRILSLRLDSQQAEWREVVPQSRDGLEIAAHSTCAPLSTLSGGVLFATYLHKASHRIRCFSTGGESLGEAQIPGLFTVLHVVGGPEGVDVAVTRFTSPYQHFRLATPQGAARLISSISVSAELDRADVDQAFCTSRDGTTVPYFLIRREGSRGPAPTLLYGYGGFGTSLTPSFRPDLAAWLALGGHYAVANTRGGGEFGREWHEAGMKTARQGTFEDFCAAGRALIETGVCQRGSLVARGLSNGGLLVAASVILCPELWAAAAIEVPLLDVVHLRDLPAGAALVAELGDPAEDRQTFESLRAYSPLQNVAPHAQRPALLVAPGERDERVAAGQSYKFVAALQSTSSPSQVALLREVKGEGHVGWPWPVEREVLLDELAFLRAFAAQGIAFDRGETDARA